MNKLSAFFASSLVSSGLLFTLTAPALANTPAATITENGFVQGTMEIDFGTRRNLDTSGKLTEGSPAEGSKDVYKVNLNVAKTTEYAGTISREPRLVSRVLGRTIQDARIVYDIGLAVRNPQDLTQKKQVGKWVGPITIDNQGVYDFGGTGGGSQLRMAIDSVGKAAGFVGLFSGKIYGKSPEKKGVLSDKFTEYTRIIKGKKAVVKAKNVDPLKFVNLTLGEGPAQVYPKTVVNGNLDYDYETGNWYTNGIRMKYAVNGTDVEDFITGSIKWVEDPNRESNGKGHYEFNLRFNEDQAKPASDESAAFADGQDLQGEEAFFAFDDSVPSMTGTISYEDDFGASNDDGEPTVISSKIAYNLNVNKLTKQQAVNLFKLWTVIVGPTNDE